MKAMDIPKSVGEFKTKISTSLGEIIGTQLESSMEGLLTNLKKVAFSANKIVDAQSTIDRAISAQSESLEKFPELVKQNTAVLSQSVGKLPNEINGLIGKRTEMMKMSVEELKTNATELQTLVNELSQVIMSKRK